MLKPPFVFRSVVFFCLALIAANSATAQDGAQVIVIDGVVSKNVKSDTDPAPHLVGVKDAVVVLCASPSGSDNCSTLASTVTDTSGSFEIVLDNVVSDSTYTLRARAEGEVWSEQSLGQGQEAAKWPKSAEITLGNTPSIRKALSDAAAELQSERANNLRHEAQTVEQIQATQMDIADKQRTVQTAQAAIDISTALPTDKSAYENEVRRAQAKVEDEQKEVEDQQRILRETQDVDAVTDQRQQEVAQRLSMLDQLPPQFGTKRVIFATDRKTSTKQGKPQILNEKNDTGDLTYGLCDAAVERQGDFANNLLYWIQDRDADRFYSIQKISLISKESMWKEVSTELSSASPHDALLFIHGFNVSFDDACRRAAQIAYDIKFPGPVFLYSWPSHASALAYADDGKMAAATRPNFTKFVKEILAHHGIEHLHILAHSMGNRILMYALFVDKLTSAEQAHLGQVVFAAPDVDRSNFDKNIVVTSIKPMRVTLYASNHDQALAMSKIANCGKTLFFNCVGRVGDTRPNIDIKLGMDSIDASAVDTSLMGHSYIGGSRSVLADFAALVSDNKDPVKRFGVLEKGQTPNTWWVISP